MDLQNLTFSTAGSDSASTILRPRGLFIPFVHPSQCTVHCTLHTVPGKALCNVETTLQRYYNLQTSRQKHNERYVYIALANRIKHLTPTNSKIINPLSCVVNVIKFALIVLFFAFLALGRSDLGQCVRHLFLHK